jgi:hypothetical protein
MSKPISERKLKQYIYVDSDDSDSDSSEKFKFETSNESDDSRVPILKVIHIGTNNVCGNCNKRLTYLSLPVHKHERCDKYSCWACFVKGIEFGLEVYGEIACIYCCCKWI